MSDPSISLITTCKGRLHHLKQTLPGYLRADVQEVVVVDYDCPDGTGDWLRQNPSDRLKVVRLDDRPNFNISEARNCGARASTGRFLFFVDADVEIATGIRKDRLSSGTFFHGEAHPSIKGTCIVSREAFDLVGGYDGNFRVWGGEDTDLYQRLSAHGLVGAHFEDECFRPILHDDSERIRYRMGMRIVDARRVSRLYLRAKIAMAASGLEPGQEDLATLYGAIETVYRERRFRRRVVVRLSSGHTVVAHHPRRLFGLRRSGFRVRILQPVACRGMRLRRKDAD